MGGDPLSLAIFAVSGTHVNLGNLMFYLCWKCGHRNRVTLEARPGPSWVARVWGWVFGRREEPERPVRLVVRCMDCSRYNAVTVGDFSMFWNRC